MGKKFAVFEVESFAGGFVPISGPVDDKTWIDSRHVIDTDRLRYGIPQGEMTLLVDREHTGWWPSIYTNRNMLILDPPKPEGDEITTPGQVVAYALDAQWRVDGQYPGPHRDIGKNIETIDRILNELGLRKMSRGK